MSFQNFRKKGSLDFIHKKGGVGKIEPPTKFSKRGSLTRSQFLEGVAAKEGVIFVKGGLLFFFFKLKKSDIFNDKKSL